MGRADSALRGRMIFNFGARRSGTWWLQRLVTAHPAVAAVPTETYLFSGGIAPLFDSFQHADRNATFNGRVYAERDLLVDATRDFCDRIFAQFLDGGETRIAERTPWHARHIDLMSEIYPDAYYVHIYRDGRDAARSLAAMRWFDGSLEDAAAEWRESVLAARSARRPERYFEIRYEDLLRDPRGNITELYEFLDLELDDGILARALAEARTERNTDPGTPVGTEKWRDLLTQEQQATVMAIAGDALAEYGYVSRAEPGRARTPAGGDGDQTIKRLVRRLRGGG